MTSRCVQYMCRGVRLCIFMKFTVVDLETAQRHFQMLVVTELIKHFTLYSGAWIMKPLLLNALLIMWCFDTDYVISKWIV